MTNDEYMKKVEKIDFESTSRNNLVIPLREETLDELIKEGERLLLEDQKTKKISLPKDESKQLDSKLAINSKNPYAKSWMEVLGKMPEGERKVIEKMAAGTLEKDSRYDRFAHTVAVEGDKLSS